MTTSDDQQLKDFFDQMKAAERPVPEIRVKRKSNKGRLRKMIFYGVAASIILLVSSIYIFSSQDIASEELTASEIEEMTSEIDEMMSWSSETDYLLIKN